MVDESVYFRVQESLRGPTFSFQGLHAEYIAACLKAQALCRPSLYRSRIFCKILANWKAVPSQGLLFLGCSCTVRQSERSLV